MCRFCQPSAAQTCSHGANFWTVRVVLVGALESGGFWLRGHHLKANLEVQDSAPSTFWECRWWRFGSRRIGSGGSGLRESGLRSSVLVSRLVPIFAHADATCMKTYSRPGQEGLDALI